MSTPVDELHPNTPVEPHSEVAEWVGEIDGTRAFSDEVRLTHAAGFLRARLLVRMNRRTLGFVTVGVDASVALGREIAREVARLAPRTDEITSEPDRDQPISVVLCTRDRPDGLRRALSSILDSDHRDFEVVVVDNASSSLDSWRIVAELDDPRVRIIQAQRPGLAFARNRGVVDAKNALIAFTDDDVSVDSGWLSALVGAFTDRDVACVTGLVPPAELATTAQVAFQSRVGWTGDISTRKYRYVDGAQSRGALFPFRAGAYGTGANFAARREHVIALGGFDERLGAGAPARGGEDIDFFVRSVVAGRAVVFQPDAIVWHHHRADDGAYRDQMMAYGVGLGAWLTKVALDRRLRPIAIRRAAPAAAHLVRSVFDRSGHGRPAPNGSPGSDSGWDEVRGLLRGPAAFRASRREGRVGRPLDGTPVRATGR